MHCSAQPARSGLRLARKLLICECVPHVLGKSIAAGCPSCRVGPCSRCLPLCEIANVPYSMARLYLACHVSMHNQLTIVLRSADEKGFDMCVTCGAAAQP